jgi:phosphatidyl-myo-inositol dimannoside synthase
MAKLYLWFPNIFEFKGGIQVYLLDLLRALSEQIPTSEIRVYDKLDTGRIQESIHSKDKISFRFYGNTPKILRTVHFSLSLLIGSLLKRPNLIICGHLHFAPVAFFLHTTTGIPYWILVYGTDAWEVKNPLKKKALKTAERIISISGYTRDRLLNEQQLDPQKISLLPVTFDDNRFKITTKPSYLMTRYGLSPDQPVILTVARLSSGDGYKGYDQVIRALPQIRQKFPTVQYILVGKGDDASRIEKLIKSLNIQEHVTLTGFIPDEELVDHYNLCDLFAMPSKGEGFGIVYLEALACGKPTIGGNKDGAIDALCHGKLGALIDPDSIDQLAETISQILDEAYPNTLMFQPKALRKAVTDIFGFKKFKDTLNELLKSALLKTKSGVIVNAKTMQETEHSQS